MARYKIGYKLQHDHFFKLKVYTITLNIHIYDQFSVRCMPSTQKHVCVKVLNDLRSMLSSVGKPVSRREVTLERQNCRLQRFYLCKFTPEFKK